MGSVRHAWGYLLCSWERLLGPLFEKELRVASRQKRGYALRTAYVLLLLTIVVVTWGIWVISSARGAGPIALSIRLSQACQELIIATVWFQIIAMQWLAIAMLLTSHLSDQEIIESKATAAIRRNLPLWG